MLWKKRLCVSLIDLCRIVFRLRIDMTSSVFTREPSIISRIPGPDAPGILPVISYWSLPCIIVLWFPKNSAKRKSVIFILPAGEWGLYRCAPISQEHFLLWWVIVLATSSAFHNQDRVYLISIWHRIGMTRAVYGSMDHSNRRLLSAPQSKDGVNLVEHAVVDLPLSKNFQMNSSSRCA